MSHKEEKVAGSATAYNDDSLHVYVELGEIDLEAEVKRLETKLAKEEKELQRLEKKLANRNFIEKAPEEVVEETKEKLEVAKNNCERLKKIIDDLK